MRWLLAICLSALPAAAQEFTTLKGHGGPIMDLAVTPGGRVVSASFDNALGVWTGRQPAWLDGHDAAVTAAAVTRDGMVLSGSDDFTVRLWQDSEPRVLGHHKGKVADVAFSPDGTMAASASWDGTIGLWPLSRGAPKVLRSPDGGVNALAFAQGGNRLYAATNGGSVLVYDLTADETPLRLAQHGFGINRLVLTNDWLAYGAIDGATRVIAADTGEPVADFTLDRRPILAMALHAETGQLAVGDGHGYIMMLDTERWRIARDFRATRRGPVWALAFSPGGHLLYSGGLDDVVYGWPVEAMDAFEPAPTGERSFLRDVASMPNGERQFMRKCSICHALNPGASRKAGPTLYGVFGRRAGTVPGYSYSPTLSGSDIIWSSGTIDALFNEGPDHYVPGSKMPMQRIAAQEDRNDLISFLKSATEPGDTDQ